MTRWFTRARLIALLFIALVLGGGGYRLAAQSNTSTGGVFSPLLNYVVAGTWTWLGGSPLIFEGATNDSKTTTIAITDPTANRTWTIQDATDTFVGRATTDTLTNKTLTSPAMTSPTISGTPVLNILKGNFSTATVSAGYASDTYLAGSNIAIPMGGWIAGGRYVSVFDMVKTAAGTAQFTINLRMGTGVVGDTSLIQWQFAAGTAAADTATCRVTAHFRTVGSGTSAVLVGTAECAHALAATGLISTGASGYGSITSVSSGFDSTTANGVIGLSVNGGASFSGTNTIVETEYRSF